MQCLTLWSRVKRIFLCIWYIFLSDRKIRRQSIIFQRLLFTPSDNSVPMSRHFQLCARSMSNWIYQKKTHLRPGHPIQCICLSTSWQHAEELRRHELHLWLHPTQTAGDRSLQPYHWCKRIHAWGFLPIKVIRKGLAEKVLMKSDQFIWRNVRWFQYFGWRSNSSFITHRVQLLRECWEYIVYSIYL